MNKAQALALEGKDFNQLIAQARQVSQGMGIFFTGSRLGAALVMSALCDLRSVRLIVNLAEMTSALESPNDTCILVCPSVRQFLVGWKAPKGLNAAVFCSAKLYDAERKQLQARFNTLS